MSDYLKVAKDAGAIVEGCNVLFSGRSFDECISRILASQQAAHEAEIARFKDWIEGWLVSAKTVGEQLSASQARGAELREMLESAEAMNSLQSQSIEMLSKELEAAEARIKASQEQDFVCTVLSPENHTVWWNDKYTDISQVPKRDTKLYAQPIIPPDLAELQRENAELRKLLVYCRGSVKTDLNNYERLLLAKEKLGEQETPTYAVASDEANRLSDLLDIIDTMLSAQPKEPKQ